MLLIKMFYYNYTIILYDLNDIMLHYYQKLIDSFFSVIKAIFQNLQRYAKRFWNKNELKYYALLELSASKMQK